MKHKNDRTINKIKNIVTVYLHEIISMFITIENSMEINTFINEIKIYEIKSNSINNSSILYTIIKLLECFENKTFNYSQELPIEIINKYIEFINEYKSKDIPIK